MATMEEDPLAGVGDSLGPIDLPMPPSSTSAGPSASAEPPVRSQEITLPKAALPENFLRLTVPMSQAYGGVTNQNGHVAAPYLGGAPPGGYGGRLRVTCLQARLAKNYGLLKMDPFVRLILGPHAATSRVCNNGAKEPRWNQRVVIPAVSGFESLRVEVVDMGTFSDTIIAWGDIDITPALAGSAQEEWYPLSGKQGEGKEGVIHLHIAFESAPPAPQYVMGPQAYNFMQPPVLYPNYPQSGMMPPQPVTMQPVPPPQAQRSPANPADILQIKSMFPDIGEDVIQSVLAANNGDKEATINGLLSMG